MKNVILFLFCFKLFLAFTQPACDHNVSTNYLNPTNNALPLGNEQYLNRFNWNAKNPDGTYKLYKLNNMTFGTTMFDKYMLGLMSNQQNNYYLSIYDGPVMSYENGWELLLLNIGRFPNMDEISEDQVELRDIPYIILYNRYKGIIRLFANYGNGAISDELTVNALTVNLYYDDYNKVNGLLRLAEGQDKALDQKTSAFMASAISLHPNVSNQWFSCDFQVAYDPCICHTQVGDKPTNLRIKFNVAENVDFELIGREIAVEENLIDGKAVKPKDFFSIFNPNGEDLKGGLIMYKTLDFMVNDYLSRYNEYEKKLTAVNEHNAYIKRNKAIIKAFKSIILAGGDAGITAISKAEWFNDLLTYANEFIGTEALKKDKLAEEAKKLLGKEVETFFSENFSEKSPPQAPVKPTASYSEMYFKGHLITVAHPQGPNFFTPGSYGSDLGTPDIGSKLAYPIYNEVLGTFAMLETPRLTISKTFKDGVQFRGLQKYQSEFEGNQYGRNYVYQNWNNHYQFKLASPLKYAFNNTLDLESYEVQVAYEIDANLKKGSSKIQSFCNENLTTNLKSKRENLTSKLVFSSRGLEFENGTNYLVFENNKYYPENTPNPPKLQYQVKGIESEFIPIDAFQHFVAETAIINEYYEDQSSVWGNKPLFGDVTEFTVPQMPYINEQTYNNDELEFKVFLKLMIVSKYKTKRSDGSANETVQFYTYEIPSSHINFVNTDIVPNLKSTKYNLDGKKDLKIGNVTFNGGPIAGCSLSGTTYTCKAWNTISIDGNVTVANGYDVKLIAGSEVIQSPESVVSGELVTLIEPVLDFSNPMPPSDADYVMRFCKGLNQNAPSYQAHLPAPSVIEYAKKREEEQKSNAEHTNLLSLNLFPNPTRNNITLQFNQNVNSAFRCFDLSGKEVTISIEKRSENNYKIDVENLSNGVYLIEAITNQGKITKQFIVNH